MRAFLPHLANVVLDVVVDVLCFLKISLTCLAQTLLKRICLFDTAMEPAVFLEGDDDCCGLTGSFDNEGLTLLSPPHDLSEMDARLGGAHARFLFVAIPVLH